jgi:hypothetical protein
VEWVNDKLPKGLKLLRTEENQEHVGNTTYFQQIRGGSNQHKTLNGTTTTANNRKLPLLVFLFVRYSVLLDLCISYDFQMTSFFSPDLIDTSLQQ